MKAKVSLVRSKDSYRGTFAALRLLEDQLKPLIEKAKRPVIKVNFVTSSRRLAATPVEAVRATVAFIRQYSKEKILVAEQASLGTTKEAWQNYDYYSLEKMTEVELFELDNDQTFPVEIEDDQERLLTVPCSVTLHDSDFLISLTRPKTHDNVVVTLTGKNVAVGAIVGGLAERRKVHQGMKIHENMLRVLEKIKPHLAVLDGSLGMEGDGPSLGEPIKVGWGAASLDWLAVDTLAAYLMGFELKNIGYLYLAKERGMGQVFPEGVEIIGERPKALVKKFKPHSTYFSQIKWRR